MDYSIINFILYGKSSVTTDLGHSLLCEFNAFTNNFPKIHALGGIRTRNNMDGDPAPA